MKNDSLNEQQPAISDEELMWVINRILKHLNDYLDKNTFLTLENTNSTKIKEVMSKMGYQNFPYAYGSMPGKPEGTYFVVISSYRNNVLTGNRILNIITLQNKLISILKSLDSKQLESTDKDILISSSNGLSKDTPVLVKTVDKNRVHINNIKALFEKGVTENTTLSAISRKSHITYSENRKLGFGIFKSWWGKTFTTSRANDALQKGLKEIDHFSNRLNNN